MNRPFLTAIILLSFCVPLCASGAVKSGDFQYYAELGTDIRGNAIYEVVLSHDILSKCSPGCANIRLLGPDGSEIPYVILNNNKSSDPPETHNLEVVRYEQLPDVSVIIVRSPIKDKPFSIIKLDTPDRDFQRKIRIRGSNDMMAWTLLTEDSIYDFSSQVDLRKTDIKFSPSPYLYYGIDLSSAGPSKDAGEKISLQYKDLKFSADNSANRELRIDRIQGQVPSAKNTDAVYDEAEFTQFEHYQEKDGETVFFLKTGLPAGEVWFVVSDPYYYRTVEIYGSDSGEKQSYRCIGREAIYRFPVAKDNETKNHITAASDKYGYYKFGIKNGDNPPLKLNSVKFRWLRRSLYFVALHDHRKYTLAMGSPSFEKPDYDLSKFINQGNRHLQSVQLLRTSGIMENPDFEPLSTIYVKDVFEKKALTLIVVVLVIGLCYWLYQLLKKSSGAKEQP
ncbi:MAG: DUF3999 family protein [Nitrospirota bacterium]